MLISKAKTIIMHGGWSKDVAADCFLHASVIYHIRKFLHAGESVKGKTSRELLRDTARNKKTELFT